ncbi:MAG: hypothetical protein HUJ66_08875 [Oscillospiraceae bacterium]|nr:hypothetical protein [Oscillospiraceae bacterium]
MNYEVVDFKTVNVNYRLDTGMGAELGLTAESRVSVKTPDEWCGYVYLYLNTKIHDPEEKYFVFDVTTETIVKVPDEITEMSDELMEDCIPIAQEKTYTAIRKMSVAMGINELDLTK